MQAQSNSVRPLHDACSHVGIGTECCVANGLHHLAMALKPVRRESMKFQASSRIHALQTLPQERLKRGEEAFGAGQLVDCFNRQISANECSQVALTCARRTRDLRQQSWAATLEN